MLFYGEQKHNFLALNMKIREFENGVNTDFVAHNELRHL